jgi:hypothetical protein
LSVKNLDISPESIVRDVGVFLLGYIPYIGLKLAIIPPAILAMLQYGPCALIIIVVILIVAFLRTSCFLHLQGRDWNYRHLSYSCPLDIGVCIRTSGSTNQHTSHKGEDCPGKF